MNRRSYPFLALIVLLIVLAPAVLPAHATVYGAGVTVGQSASYQPVNVTYHGTNYYSPVPEWVKDLNATVQFTCTVEQFYTPTNVTVQSVAEYENSTTKTISYNGDLLTGLANLTFGLIAGGLTTGDSLWNAPYTPTINETITETILGVSRTVNVWTILTRFHSEPAMPSSIRSRCGIRATGSTSNPSISASALLLTLREDTWSTWTSGYSRQTSSTILLAAHFLDCILIRLFFSYSGLVRLIRSMQIERDYCQKQLSLKSQSFWYVRQAQKKVQRKNYSSARYRLELLR